MFDRHESLRSRHHTLFIPRKGSLIGIALSIWSIMAVAAEKEDIILFDASDERIFQVLRYDDILTLERTNEWSTHGDYALKIKYPKFEDGITTPWPRVTLPSQALAVKDWSGYEYLRLDMRVDVGKELTDRATLTFLIHGKSTGRPRFTSGDYRVWIPIDPLIGSDRQITSFALYYTRPRGEGHVIYIDNIRLTNEGPEGGLYGETVWPHWERITETLLAREDLLPTLYSEQVTDVIRENLMSKENLALHQNKRAANQMQRALGKLQAEAERDMLITTEFSSTGFGVMATSVGEQIMIDSAPKASWKKEIHLDAMLGETRSKQIVVWPGSERTLDQVHVRPTNLVHKEKPGAIIPADQITVDLIGYIYLPPNNNLASPDPDWFPDPIIPIGDSFDVQMPRRQQPLLFSVDVPRNTEPGLYQGSLEFVADGVPYVMPIELEVFAIELPERSMLPQLHHGIDPHAAIKYRLNPNAWYLGSIYNDSDAPDMETLKQWREKGLDLFNLYSIKAGVIQQFAKKYGEEEGVERFLQKIYKQLPDTYMEALAEAGLANRAVFYGFDESHLHNPLWSERIERIFGALLERYGKYGVRTATTAFKFGDIEHDHWDLPIDIWIVNFSGWDKDKAQLARDTTGMEVWWYQVEWNIWNTPFWSRALPWATRANDAHGWLYYNFMQWYIQDQVLGNDPLTDWNPASLRTGNSYGVGALFYRHESGTLQPSLRMINMRQGLTDYDLLAMLGEAVENIDESTIASVDRSKQYRYRRAKRIAGMSDYTEQFNTMLIFPNDIPVDELSDAGMTDHTLDKLRLEAAKLLMEWQQQ